MTSKKLSLSVLVFVLLISMVSAGSFVTVKPVNSLNLSQGYSVILNITDLNGMQLNSSASFGVNIIGAASIIAYTSTGTSRYSGNASYVLTTAPKALPVNIIDALGYNQTYIYNGSSVHVRISSPPFPSANVMLNLSQCGTSSSFQQNSINVRATAPPCADLNLSKEIPVNGTYAFTSNVYGISLLVGVAPQNIHEDLGLNQSIALPGNIVISSPSVNDIANNQSLQEEVMSSLASENCTPNGLATYIDNKTHRVVSICTDFTGLGYDIPAMIASQPISSNRTMSGYAQMCAAGFQQANATGREEAYTANQYLNEYNACEAVNNPENLTSPANELAFTRAQIAASQPGLAIVESAIIVIILLGAGFFGVRTLLEVKSRAQRERREK